MSEGERSGGDGAEADAGRRDFVRNGLALGVGLLGAGCLSHSEARPAHAAREGDHRVVQRVERQRRRLLHLGTLDN